MVPLDRMLRWCLPGLGLALGLSVLLVGWFTQPPDLQRGYAPVQPIPFSHQLHAGTLKMSCLYCHAGAERSPIAGVPGAELCLGCHAVTRTEHPAIQALAQSYQAGQTLLWKRVYRTPDHVFFDHRPHVQAGLACQACHGEVQTMEVLARQGPLHMGDCLNCHRHPQPALPPGSPITRAAEHCAACHR